MKQNYLSEIIYQVFALIICVIVVHTVYVAVVLPNAAFILEQQAAMQAADSSYVAPRSLYVILRDMEQETCIILMFWALAIIGMKTRRVLQERSLLDRELLQVSEGTSILPDDVRCRHCPSRNAPSCCRARCWRACIVSAPPAAFRTPPTLSKTSAVASPTVWRAS